MPNSLFFYFGMKISVIPHKKEVYMNNFNDFFYPHERQPSSIIFDTYKEKGEYYIEILLPGFEKEKINIEYENKKIFIEAERSVNKERNYLQKNSYFGKTNDVLCIPFEPKSIDVEYVNGVLRINIKRKEEDQPKITFN